MKFIAVFFVAAFVTQAWSLPVSEEKNIGVKTNEKKTREPNLISQIRQILEEDDEETRLEDPMTEENMEMSTLDPSLADTQKELPILDSSKASEDIVKTDISDNESKYVALEIAFKSEGENLALMVEEDSDVTTITPTIEDEVKKIPTLPKAPETTVETDPKTIQPNEIIPERQIEVKIIQEKSDTDGLNVVEGSKISEPVVNETENQVDLTKTEPSCATISPVLKNIQTLSKIQLQQTKDVLKSLENTPEEVHNRPSSIEEVKPKAKSTVEIDTKVETVEVKDEVKKVEEKPEEKLDTGSETIETKDVVKKIEEIPQEKSSIEKETEVKPVEIKDESIKTEEKIQEKTSLEKVTGVETVEIKDDSKKVEEKTEEGLTVSSLLRGISGNDVGKLKGLQNAIRSSLESTVPRLTFIQLFDSRIAKEEDWDVLTESINFVSKQFNNKSVSQVLEQESLKNLLDGYEQFLKEEKEIRKSYLDKTKTGKC